jgi:putative ABC transport system ATP-binding protein
VEAVGLGARMGHQPSELSGGEKQRVAIARALVTNPDIIFADEPTGNLDSKSGKVVMSIIQKLNEEEGKTIVLITHETSTAEHAERIIRLKDGEIESDTKVAKRLTSKDDYVK